jgi:hypothetical protein
MGDLPKFHIFSGAIGDDLLWINCVEGLAAANEEMLRLAAEKPGKYFVFFIPKKQVMAQVDTTPGEPISAANEAS